LADKSSTISFNYTNSAMHDDHNWLQVQQSIPYIIVCKSHSI